MNHSPQPRPVGARAALLATMAIAAGFATAGVADAAGSKQRAERAVEKRVLRVYGAASLQPNASCKRMRTSLYSCYYLASARGTRKPMIIVGNARVRFTGRRYRVRMSPARCLGGGCPKRR